MTIILFLVDTSASMNQRTFLGTTILDVTKNAIETFQKVKNYSYFISLLVCLKIIFYGKLVLYSLNLINNFCVNFQIRSKNPNSKWDRLMLLTYDEPPGNIKVSEVIGHVFIVHMASQNGIALLRGVIATKAEEKIIISHSKQSFTCLFSSYLLS